MKVVVIHTPTGVKAAFEDLISACGFLSIPKEDLILVENSGDDFNSEVETFIYSDFKLILHPNTYSETLINSEESSHDE